MFKSIAHMYMSYRLEHFTVDSLDTQNLLLSFWRRPAATPRRRTPNVRRQFCFIVVNISNFAWYEAPAGHWHVALKMECHIVGLNDLPITRLIWKTWKKSVNLNFQQIFNRKTITIYIYQLHYYIYLRLLYIPTRLRFVVSRFKKCIKNFLFGGSKLIC